MEERQEGKEIKKKNKIKYQSMIKTDLNEVRATELIQHLQEIESHEV